MSGEAGEYTTLLYPFDSFENRIPDTFFSEGGLSAKGWSISRNSGGKVVTEGLASDALLMIRHSSGVFLLGATWIVNDGQRVAFSERSDCYLEYRPDGSNQVLFLGHKVADAKLQGTDTMQLQPGDGMLLD